MDCRYGCHEVKQAGFVGEAPYAPQGLRSRFMKENIVFVLEDRCPFVCAFARAQPKTGIMGHVCEDPTIDDVTVLRGDVRERISYS